jgi:hypothetical protein
MRLIGSMVLPVPGIDILVSSINSNPYFIGIMMLFLNLGGRFLSLEVSKGQEKFLSDPIIRRFLLFVVLFVATRNVLVAAGLTIIVVILLGYLLNENSDIYIFHSMATKKPEVAAEASTFGLSMEETMILKRLQDKQAQTQAKPKEKVEESPSAFHYYMSSIQQLSG